MEIHIFSGDMFGLSYEPEVILETTGDRLVIPSIWIKVHINWCFGC